MLERLSGWSCVLADTLVAGWCTYQIYLKGNPLAGYVFVLVIQGHSIIPRQLEATLRNGRPASAAVDERSNIVSRKNLQCH
jgi:hypothetical protein